MQSLGFYLAKLLRWGHTGRYHCGSRPKWLVTCQSSFLQAASSATMSVSLVVRCDLCSRFGFISPCCFGGVIPAAWLCYGLLVSPKWLVTCQSSSSQAASSATMSVSLVVRCDYAVALVLSRHAASVGSFRQAPLRLESQMVSHMPEFVFAGSVFGHHECKSSSAV
jgi:hypothetical protein